MLPKGLDLNGSCGSERHLLFEKTNISWLVTMGNNMVCSTGARKVLSNTTESVKANIFIYWLIWFVFCLFFQEETQGGYIFLSCRVIFTTSEVLVIKNTYWSLSKMDCKSTELFHLDILSCCNKSLRIRLITENGIVRKLLYSCGNTWWKKIPPKNLLGFPGVIATVEDP